METLESYTQKSKFLLIRIFAQIRHIVFKSELTIKSDNKKTTHTKMPVFRLEITAYVRLKTLVPILIGLKPSGINIVVEFF